MALIIKPTGEQYPIIPALGQFSIGQMIELVNCPHIDVLSARWIGKGIYVVSAESGFQMNKPFNATASREARKAIYGDALIAKYEELGGRCD